MIINSRSSNYLFTFPTGFFSKCVSDRFLPYVKRNFLPYDTLDTFMSAQIQSVTFPSLSMEPVQQTRLYGKKQEYKSSVPIPDLFTRDIEVTFKTLDGYINYWIFIENALEYFNFKNGNDKLYFDDMQMRFLDQEGRVVLTTQYKGTYLKSISEISLSYSDNNPDFKTFSCTFGFFEMKIFIDQD